MNTQSKQQVEAQFAAQCVAFWQNGQDPVIYNAILKGTIEAPTMQHKHSFLDFVQRVTRGEEDAPIPPTVSSTKEMGKGSASIIDPTTAALAMGGITTRWKVAKITETLPTTFFQLGGESEEEDQHNGIAMTSSKLFTSARMNDMMSWLDQPIENFSPYVDEENGESTPSSTKFHCNAINWTLKDHETAFLLSSMYHTINEQAGRLSYLEAEMAELRMAKNLTMRDNNIAMCNSAGAKTVVENDITNTSVFEDDTTKGGTFEEDTSVDEGEGLSDASSVVSTASS